MSTGTGVPEGFWRAYHEQARIDGIPATAHWRHAQGETLLTKKLSAKDSPIRRAHEQ